jgi:hypothetical protein
MNRRGFLKLFGAGLPAVVLAEKIGLIEKARKYFFAPKGGWQPKALTPEMLWNAHMRLMTQLYSECPDRGIILTNVRVPEYLHGIPYFVAVPPTTGTFYGIQRSSYPKIEWDKALEIA